MGGYYDGAERDERMTEPLTHDEIRAEIERQLAAYRRRAMHPDDRPAYLLVDRETARTLLFGISPPAFGGLGYGEARIRGLGLVVMPADGPIIRVLGWPGAEIHRP